MKKLYWQLVQEMIESFLRWFEKRWWDKASWQLQTQFPWLRKCCWRDIEVVITRRSWKPFVRKGAWVRIPLSPLGVDWISPRYHNNDTGRRSESQLIWRSTQEAEGTPLERVQVVNSGARVQIPPSPFRFLNQILKFDLKSTEPWQINSNATLKVPRNVLRRLETDSGRIQRKRTVIGREAESKEEAEKKITTQKQ